MTDPGADLDLDAIRDRYDAWADPPVDPGGALLTDIDALWKSANDVPRLLGEIEQLREVLTTVENALALTTAHELCGHCMDQVERALVRARDALSKAVA